MPEFSSICFSPGLLTTHTPSEHLLDLGGDIHLHCINAYFCQLSEYDQGSICIIDRVRLSPVAVNFLRK